MIVTDQIKFAASSTPMAGNKTDMERVARLKRLRAYMGYGDSGPRFAAFLGVAYPRYNNAERGLPLSRQMADIIARKCPGVTLEWLYHGNAAGLSVTMARALGELPEGFGKDTTSAG